MPSIAIAFLWRQRSDFLADLLSLARAAAKALASAFGEVRRGLRSNRKVFTSNRSVFKSTRNVSACHRKDIRALRVVFGDVRIVFRAWRGGTN